MHKNKYNKLCKTNEKIMIEWKMIDEKKKSRILSLTKQYETNKRKGER